VNAGGFDINNVGTLRCDSIEFVGMPPVFSSRQIIAGAGLTGGGDLSQDVTLAVGDLSGIYAVAGHNHDSAYVPVARTIAAGAGLSGGGSLSADPTLSVTADSSTQRIEVLKGGSLIATRKAANLIEGSNVILTVADDGANNRVNVTVASTGDGSSKWTEGSGYMHPVTAANRVLVGGSSDDGSNKLQVAGNSKLSGMLHVAGHASTEVARFQARTDVANARSFLSIYRTRGRQRACFPRTQRGGPLGRAPVPGSGRRGAHQHAGRRWCEQAASERTDKGHRHADSDRHGRGHDNHRHDCALGRLRRADVRRPGTRGQ
jgi:hypothetical protein